MKTIMTFATAAMLLAPVSFSHADVKESVKEGAQDAKKALKKGAHRVEEKVCETVDGKLQCFPKKVKNRAEEVKDEVKDITN